MENYYTLHLRGSHLIQSQLSPTSLQKKDKTIRYWGWVRRETWETWKTSVVHWGRRSWDKAEKYEEKFQRNSAHDLEEKFWKTLTKTPSEKTLKITGNLRQGNVYNPLIFFSSYKYSIHTFDFWNYAKPACLFGLLHTPEKMIRSDQEKSICI